MAVIITATYDNGRSIRLIVLTKVKENTLTKLVRVLIITLVDALVNELVFQGFDLAGV